MGPIPGNLLPQGVNALNEISLLIQKADGYKRKGKVTGRLAVISRQNAKPPE